MKTVVDSLGDSNSLCADRSLYGRRGTIRRGSTRVGFADNRGQVKVEHAKIGARNDSVGSAVERVTGGNGGINNLVELACRGVVVQGLLHEVGVEVAHLQLAISNRRCTQNGAVVEVTIALDLAETLSSTIGASLEVGVDLVAGSIKALQKRFRNGGQLAQCLVCKHVLEQYALAYLV